MAIKINIAEFIGKKFNRLLAIRELGRDRFGAVLWEFKCDCGAISVHPGWRVRNSQIRSCGCSRKNKANEQSVLNAIYNDYRTRAKGKNIEFLITPDDFLEIVRKNCFYCGIAPSPRNRKGWTNINGIDRMNNSMGYNLNNCVPACKICNLAKSDLSLKEFEDWLDRLVKFRLK